MTDGAQSRKAPLIFYRLRPGHEPVREWLKGLPAVERHAIGKDLLRAQWRWPVGMPLCRPLGHGLWEIRTRLPTKRTAGVLVCLYRKHLVALHGFIRKRARLRTMIWRWRESGRRSWNDEQKEYGYAHR